ncbi:MAG: hypothetical protein IPM97_15435 [Bdellovibrionaceae bacterium]|nr:hypothetical protein [Pseudobdellovibrionaceae bacterium]
MSFMKVTPVILLFLFGILRCASTPNSSRRIAQSDPIYYIDADDGNDSDDGLSESTAWRTFSKIKSKKYDPGTGFLLKRNRVWHEAFYIKSSGSPDRLIFVGSYGDGALPQINGSFDVAVQVWNPVSKNIWSTKLASDQNEEPEKMFVDSIEVAGSQLKEKASELNAEGQWAWEGLGGGTLFIYSSKSPNDWKKKIEVNVLRYGVDLKNNQYVSLKDIEVTRSRDGLRIGGSNCEISNLIAKENTINGIHVSGSSNSLRHFQSVQNGLEFQIGKTGRTGHGVLVDGANNEFKIFVASNNQEDGVQLGPQAGGGNVFADATMRGNGENCFDIKNGDQEIVGGDLGSDGESSQDCIIVHKVPHHVSILGTSAFSTTKGPVVSVFQGARVTLKNVRLRSELSSAIHIDTSAGNQSSILNSMIDGGGQISKVLIDIRGGKDHLVKDNSLTIINGIEAIRIVPTAEATLENNRTSSSQ